VDKRGNAALEFSSCSRGLIVGVATCDFPPWGVGGTWEWDQTRGLLEVHCQSACRLGGWREWRGSCLEYKNRKGDPRRDPVAAKTNILLVLSSVRTLCCFFFFCHARLEAAGWKFTVCASGGPEVNAPISQARTEGTRNAEIIVLVLSTLIILLPKHFC
jgi:hypothetical protein